MTSLHILCQVLEAQRQVAVRPYIEEPISDAPRASFVLGEGRFRASFVGLRAAAKEQGQGLQPG